jgi:predicted Zn-dependent peptidase
MTLTFTNASLLSRLNAPVVKRLSNGLTIIAEQMPVEAVNLSLWLGVGSSVESNDINGMAHFLEHMIFKGTRHIPEGEFERMVEKRGAVTNAATSQDYTQYHITCSPDAFQDLAPLQIELVLNAAIPDEAFHRERSVILEEIRRSHDNPRRRTFYRSMEMAFEELPYRRPVLGPTSVVEDLTPNQMRDFHTTWYQPQSMTAVAVGNLPVDEMVHTITTSFETARPHDSLPTKAITNAGRSHIAHLAPESPFDAIVRHEYEDASLQQARMVLMWRVPGLADMYQTYALDVLAYALGQGRTARLVRDLREDRRLVSHVSVNNVTYCRQGIFSITAQLPTAHLAEVEQLILEHVQRLKVELLLDSELQRIRKLVANQFIFGNETPGSRAGLYGYYHTLVGDLEPALSYPSRIHALEPEDLQRAAQTYLHGDRYGIVVAKPTQS